MLGDTAYNALFRLVEYWRHNAPHLEHLYVLTGHMMARYAEAQERLNKAAEYGLSDKAVWDPAYRSSEFMHAWDAHWEEEGAAVFGNHTYAGCVVLLASSALLRFKDDLDVPEPEWQSLGVMFGGRSVGQVVVAAANGFRHEDEWAKARVPTPQQKRSKDILRDALGPRPSGIDAPPPGRCPEVLNLLAQGQGFDGFTGTVLRFAHEVAQRRRTELAISSSLGSNP